MFRLYIVIDSVFKLRKIYYLQKFLEECKYKRREEEIKSILTDDLESCLKTLKNKKILSNLY